MFKRRSSQLIQTFALDRNANTELEESWIISHTTVGVDVWVDALDEVGDRARDDMSGLNSLLVDLRTRQLEHDNFIELETWTSQTSTGPGLVATWIGLRLDGSMSISGF